MPTLRRILKYTPAVATGFVILAWISTWIGSGMLHVRLPGRSSPTAILLEEGNFAVLPGAMQSKRWARWSSQPFALRSVIGHRLYWDRRGVLSIPLPLLSTLLLPLAIGPFISFRFRLWHYLAYTALVAVELAYYLR